MVFSNAATHLPWRHNSQHALMSYSDTLAPLCTSILAQNNGRNNGPKPLYIRPGLSWDGSVPPSSQLCIPWPTLLAWYRMVNLDDGMHLGV